MVVVAPEEARAVLALRTAVDVDDHRPPTTESRRRMVVETGNRPPVERGPFNELRSRQLVRGDSTQLALGPSGQSAGPRVYRVHVGRRAAGRQPDGQIRSE